MFGFLTGKAPREAQEQLVRLANSSALHMFMQIKEGDTYRTPHKTFDLTSGEERSRLREAFLNIWMRIPKNRDHWPNAMRRLDELLRREDADLYEVAAVHMVMGPIKCDYACELALQYPRDRQMLDMAHKLVAMNSHCLDKITREQPGDIFGGFEMPSPFVREVMSDLPNCHRVSEAFLDL